MSKVTKNLAITILHTLAGVVLAIILLFLTLTLALSLPRTQSFVARKVVEWLSTTTNTHIAIDNISIERLTRLSAEGIYVEDLQGDTLLWVAKASATIDRRALLSEGSFVPKNVEAKDVLLDMKTDSLGTTNIDQLILQIESHFPTDTTTSSAPFRIEGAKVENMCYRLYDYHLAGQTPDGVIDYSDMDLAISSAHFGAIEVDGPVVTLSDISNLNAIDRSGASLENSSLGSLTVGVALLDFRDIDLHSGKTHLQLPYLIIEGPNWKSYSDFCDKVTLRLETRSSTLEAESAGRFVDVLGNLGIYGERINGVFDGTVCDFSADIAARLYDSEVAVIGEVQQLLHPEVLTAEVDVDLGTTPNKLSQIYQRILHKPLPTEVEAWSSKFDTLTLDGIVKLSPNVVDADALVATNLGDVEIDGLLNYAGGNIAFEGYLSGNDIALGRLASVEQLGQTDIEAQGYIVVKEQRIEGDIAAMVQRLDWKEYEFADIALQTSLSQGAVQATANSLDPNLRFTLEGSALLNPEEAPEYNLLLNLERANLSALGLTNNEDSNSWLTANLEANLEGQKLDDMNGRAMINDLVYVSKTDTLSTELINISLSSAAGAKSFSLYSPIADVEYHSNASYEAVAQFFTHTIPSKLPLALRSKAPQEAQKEPTPSLGGRLYAADDYSAISINIKEGEELASALIHGSNLAPDSSLSLEFAPSAGEFTLMLDSEYVVVDDVVVSQFHLDADGTAERIRLGGECEELLAMGLSVPEVSVEASCANGEMVDLALYFSNSDAALSGRLNVAANLVHDTEGRIVAHASVDDSYLLSPSERWDIGANKLEYSANGLAIDNFHISNNAGGLYVNGDVSNNSTTPLSLSLNNIALGEWLAVTGVAKGVDGTIDGLLKLHSLTSEPYGEGAIVFSSLSAGGIDIDPMGIDVEIPQGSSRLNVELSNTNLDSTLMVGDIDYQTGDYNSDITIGQIDLSLIDPLLAGIVSQTKGLSQVDMRLSGSRGSLDVDGSLRVSDFATQVDFTGAQYKAESVEVVFDNNRGTISPFRVADSENGWAEAEGYINFEKLDNIDFGFSLVPHNLVAIDLDANQSTPFYGKVYASGGLRLLSKNGTTEISGAVSTGSGSVFNIPLQGNNDFAGADFVTFVNRSEVVEEENSVVAQKRYELSNPNKNNSKGNLTMDVMLGVDTDTQLRLLIDPATDNIIEARGVADLGITLDSRKKDLAIRGDYQISEGVYNFNFQNLITKQFTINSGSFLRWNGDPLDADIDVGATYKLKTSLAPLLGAESSASRASTPVECIVNLTGSLSKVDVSFDINVPTANTEYQSILSSYFSSQEMMATQFVYLLALGNFYSDSTGPSTTAGTAGTAIGLDFLASQVSRLVSNDAYKFNLKYKAIDDTSSSYSIDFQTEIIDDRLLLELEANVDTGDYYQSMGGETNQLSGGGAITLLLDGSGDFYLKGFSRTIDRFDENQGLQENGVGLYYKRSFNHFGDLWRKKKSSKRDDSKKSDNFASEPEESAAKSR